MGIDGRTAGQHPNKLIVEFSQLGSIIPVLAQRIAENKPCLIHIKHAELELTSGSRRWLKFVFGLCEERNRNIWTLHEFLSAARKLAEEEAKRLIKYARGVPGGFYGRLLSHVVIARRIGLVEAKEGTLINLITSYSGKELIKKAGKTKGTLRFKLDKLRRFLESPKITTLVTLELTPHENFVELRLKGIRLFKALPPYVHKPLRSLKSKIIDPIANGIEQNTKYKVRRKYRIS